MGFSPRRLVAALALTSAFVAPPASASIIDEWASVKAPPAPQLEAVKVDPATTAYLVLDIVTQLCNGDYAARCRPVLPNMARLLQGARANKMLVVYSTFSGPASIMPAVAPQGTEPMLVSHADKFIGTNLDQVLKEHGIKTVIVTGIASNGALMYTGSHAALLGYNVVVPVDTTADLTPYAEQYAIWNFAHAPTVAAQTKLTRSDMVSF